MSKAHSVTKISPEILGGFPYLYTTHYGGDMRLNRRQLRQLIIQEAIDLSEAPAVTLSQATSVEAMGEIKKAIVNVKDETVKQLFEKMSDVIDSLSKSRTGLTDSDINTLMNSEKFKSMLSNAIKQELESKGPG